jgi:iron(III) transport system permease protein
MQSARNSVVLAASVVGISVPLDFVFAYALTRSTLPAPLKAVFRLVALIPLLAP